MASSNGSGAVDALGQARRTLGISVPQLWIAYIGVGGNGTPGEVARWMSGAEPVPEREYDLLAVALNEEFLDRGLPNPMS